MTEVHDAIAAANATLEQVFEQGDAAGMAALYTQDGQLGQPNGDFVIGRPAIQAYWQAVFDRGIKQIKLDIVEVEAHGDTAIEVCKFTLYASEGQEAYQGKGIVILKRQDGEWKVHRDIVNSSLPAPG